jgi:hypothetical protein
MSDEIIMPFGAYKGKAIHEIPSGYLKWMAENLDDHPDLQEAADDEYQYRERYNAHQWG